MNKLFDKELKAAGSSGSADAAPRMTECCESGRSTPICHCETAQTKNNPANCFCAQSNETQKAKRQCGRIDVGIGATKQSGEIASHSFAMTEYGRSMVEMLGMLAVMGIIGIIGISGYNNAMNKHRANELLNEANKRATIVAMQFASGHTEGNLNEFTNNTFAGGTFATTVRGWPAEFALNLSNVNKSVCQNMLNSIGDKAPVKILNTHLGSVTCQNTNELLLVYNKDLSIGVTQDNKGCLSGQSFCGKDEDNNPICCPNNAFCDSSGQTEGQCFYSSFQCATNEDCLGQKSRQKTLCEKSGDCFCAIGIGSGTASSIDRICDKGFASYCLAFTEEYDILDFVPSNNIFDAEGNLIFAKESLLMGGPDTSLMTWWSARNWCLAKGKKLLDISNNRLQCFQGRGYYGGTSDGATSFDETIMTRTTCNIYGITTQSVTALENKSRLMQELVSDPKLTNRVFWTGNDSGTNSGCSAFIINLQNDGGMITTAAKDIQVYRFLCE